MLVAIKMRTVVIILTVLLSTSIFAQNSEDSVLNTLEQQFNLTDNDHTSIRIEFNPDTILIAGYLGNPKISSKKNIIYKTTDGGKKWRAVEFNGNAWIYGTYHKQDGKIWMGGSDNVIHYSNDFGETWKRKIKPFNPVNRVLSIYMVDSLYGVAGGLSNGLAITNDNWSSSTQIETPIDQNRFRILKESARNRIDKIAIIDSLILINQNDYIFYSKVKYINWQKFNIPISNFNIDERTKEIDLFSRKGKHFVIGSDLKLRRSYIENNSFWEPLQDDTTHIDLTDFLSTPLKTIEITSTKCELDKQVHMTALYFEIIQLANIILKDKTFYFKSKGYKKRSVEFNQDDMIALLSNDFHIQLNELSNYLRFSELDFANYELVLKCEYEKRKEQEKWGGNFTSQICLENPLFKEYKNVTSKINQDYLNSVFNQHYLSFLFENKKNSITAIFKNEKNEKVIISNVNSILYSLPWTIKYKGVTINSYNPNLTEFFKSILPTNFNNYEMILGGQLIYDLVEEKIIDELKYNNSY